MPTSANQEDHVSMATFAARRLHDMIDNVEHIIAIELLAAAQGIDFHHPCKSSETLEKVLAEIREVSPSYGEDRSLSADIERVVHLIDGGTFVSYTASVLPSVS